MTSSLQLLFEAINHLKDEQDLRSRSSLAQSKKALRSQHLL
ncbi:hypothetical protein [Fischerella sp. FACHB-380]|nr:hypothetical protein [Fischerella sp. FACHB-380]